MYDKGQFLLKNRMKQFIMNQQFIIAAFGRDQAGIVGAFSQVLFENRCNLEDTSMTLLEDHFTMLIILTAPDGVTALNLENALEPVKKRFDLQVSIFPIDAQGDTGGSVGNPWTISVSGPDQTGILYHITRYLGEKAVNIRHLSSKRLNRPGGEPLYLMAVEADVPDSVSTSDLQRELADIARREGLEMMAEPMEIYTL